MKDCDPTTGQPDSEDGYDDEYILEDLEITIADQVQKTKKNNFTVAWDSADTEGKLFLFASHKITYKRTLLHRMG